MGRTRGRRRRSRSSSGVVRSGACRRWSTPRAPCRSGSSGCSGSWPTCRCCGTCSRRSAWLTRPPCCCTGRGPSPGPRGGGMIGDLYEPPAVLAGRKVLIVDDDIRNIFALTSVLERYDMEVLAAETGRGAISTLERTPGIDMVLMDIMIPERDGSETIPSIRRSPRWKDLPIVAVTAKAMKGDREKTLEAGAWDYLAKPVDTEHMLAMLRGWLYR